MDLAARECLSPEGSGMVDLMASDYVGQNKRRTKYVAFPGPTNGYVRSCSSLCACFSAASLKARGVGK